MDLTAIVAALMQEGKGILLEGESNEIESERLAAFGVSTEDARKAYRELLLTTPGIEGHLNGVILSPEGVHESVADGTTFPQVLKLKNILSGVSLGATLSVDGTLADTLKEYSSHGISFAYFALPAAVSEDAVTDDLQKDILALAACAKISHEEGIVPVLSLDVSMYGAHTAAHAEDSILEILALLSDALKGVAVNLTQVVVGVSMAVSGSENPARAHAPEVAERSVRALTTGIPESVGGVVFLSDAQNPEEGTANLNALARLEPLPWPIAFCFSRVLQDPVLAVWKGVPENFAEAQAVFEARLALLSRADAAAYSETFEDR